MQLAGFISHPLPFLTNYGPANARPCLFPYQCCRLAVGQPGKGAVLTRAALLEIKSTTQGLLLPRLSKAQRDALTASATAPPVAGLVIYQTDNTPGLYAYDGTGWGSLGGDNLGNHTATQSLILADKRLVGGTAAVPGTTGVALDRAGQVGIGIAAPLAALHVSGGSALFTAAGYVPAPPRWG